MQPGAGAATCPVIKARRSGNAHFGAWTCWLMPSPRRRIEARDRAYIRAHFRAAFPGTPQIGPSFPA